MTSSLSCFVCYSVVKVGSDLYSQSWRSLQWLAKGNNWKYLFLVPSRAMAYQQKKEQEMKGGRSRTVIEEYTFNGIKFRITDPDVDADDWINEDSEEKDTSEDVSSSASNSGRGSGRVLWQRTEEAILEKEYFAGSRKPRHPRPTAIKYRVGQVVKHRRYGFYGVIVGWDEVAKVGEQGMHTACGAGVTVGTMWHSTGSTSGLTVCMLVLFISQCQQTP